MSPWEVPARPWAGTAAEYERLVGTCTLLMMTTRGKYLRRSLAHYAAARGLFSEILVVWNDPDLPFPAWKDKAPRPPRPSPDAPAVRWLRMRDNHMHNRFTLYGEVRTECVVVADDDIVVPHNATRYAFRVWRGDFFQQIVGHRYFARAHSLQRGLWRYVSPDHRAQEWSMMLPGAGTIFHRELLRHFVHPYLAPARQVVIDTHNCDDILVNFLATSVSGRGPVVLHVLGWADIAGVQLNETSESHLSTRRGHFADRDRCLADFLDFFGHTERALVFTTAAFSWDGSYGASQLPGRQHYRSVPDVTDSWVGAPLQEGQHLWYMPPVAEESASL